MNNINNIGKDEIYKTIVQYAGDIIFLLSTSGEIINANNEAVKSYGYTEEELLSMKIEKLRNPSKLDLINHQIEKARLEGMVIVTEHYRKDSSHY